MKRRVGWKVIGIIACCLFYGGFAVGFGYSGIKNHSILAILVCLLIIAFACWIIIDDIRDVKKIKMMYPIQEQFRKYVKLAGYNYADFGYPGRNYGPPTNGEDEVFLTIPESQSEFIKFKESMSPFPERYRFFKSANEPKYIYVVDTFDWEYYLLRK